MNIDKNFIEEITDPLKECVSQASNEVMKIYRSDNFEVIDKSDGSPLTKADKKANEVIIENLKKITPTIPIITEEIFHESMLEKLDNLYWLVDPLDGTKEFINKTDEFTVNIALIQNSKSIFGIVGAPASSKLWYGSIFDENFLKSLDINFKIIEKGSSLKLCCLADNTADIYPRFGPTSEWDIAAAHAVLNSFGGSVIDIKNNNELKYSKKTSILNPFFMGFRNIVIKNDFLPLLDDFLKKLV
jgi:3'(2'), 5'-bisphosphate nucleotidase